MNKDEKLEVVTGKIIYNVIIPLMGLATKDFDILFSGIKDNVRDAYNYGYADGLNTADQSPYKCGECEGDDLILKSEVVWDRTFRTWSVVWKQTSEAYCKTCEQDVEVFRKLFGDYYENNIR